MQEFGFGFGLAMLLVTLVAVVGFSSRSNAWDEEFKGVSTRIEVYEKYDSDDLVSKKHAMDVCNKVLMDNGCVLHSATTKSFYCDGGVTFLKVIGTKGGAK